MRVLIAEDSLVSRHLLVTTLRGWGYEVTAAADGAQAWKYLQDEDAPKLAILDWIMPGMTGPEVCQRIRSQARHDYTYVLLLTSKNEKQDLIEGMESGADDYITKPFDHHELKVRLRAGQRILELQAELLAAREALREQATKDSLTGIWNRSSIFDILERSLARAAREERPLGLVLIDLDHFKTVNDAYGHLAGDAVLREAARRLKSAVRVYDDVGRYGGEEFLVVLPGCDEQGATSLAERMREQLEAEPVVVHDAAVTITGSFGVVTAVDPSQTTPEALVHTADDALYAAKRAGRNRVITESSTQSACRLRVRF
jgi:diguanylate cyclase (GGDEF)-like protein